MYTCFLRDGDKKADASPQRLAKPISYKETYAFSAFRSMI